jgi:16S rRNA (guanine1207-N2)-methyltransferase
MSRDHYFSADPSVPFERETFTCEVWGHELTLVSGAGVFSRGHLDHATAVLFRETEPPAQGQFLDLGCGYGVIGLALAKAVPLANVTGVDVNERAVALANENARSLGVEGRFVACLPESVPTEIG